MMDTYITDIVNNISVQNITLPHPQEVATARDQLYWSKALPLLLLFNDNKDIKLSTSSFLYKNSTFLQAFDLDEDTTLRSGASSAGDVINILCPSSYVIDNNKCLFDDKTNLSFMFTLQTESATASLLPPYKFINLCKFLDIICYNNVMSYNEINIFSEQFITYVMCSIYVQKHINEIHYFMQSEIRSITNYLNNNINNLSHNDEIMCCTPEFYFLYLDEYKEDVIKYNRRDIYELSINKNEYYVFIRKYVNNLTEFVKQTYEYNNDEQIITINKIEDYDIDALGNDLLLHCLYNRKSNINYSYLIKYSDLSHCNCIDKNALMTIIELHCHYSIINYLKKINDYVYNDWNNIEQLLLSTYSGINDMNSIKITCEHGNKCSGLINALCRSCLDDNERQHTTSPLLNLILSFNPPQLTAVDIDNLCPCESFDGYDSDYDYCDHRDGGCCLIKFNNDNNPDDDYCSWNKYHPL